MARNALLSAALLLVSLLVPPTAGEGAACSTPADCNLLGECIGAQCECDAGFTGPRCEQLDLGPADPMGALRLPNKVSSWGGNVIKINRTYHLYASNVGPCGLKAFKRYSRVIHATSAAAAGPYTYRDTVAETVAHNAYPVHGPDGQLLVYYIGTRADPPTWDCAAAARLPPPPGNIVGPINVAASPNGNPTGPWTHYTDIFPDRTRAGVSWAATTASNPAVIFTKNGSVLMAFHGKDRGGEVPGIAHADSFAGPFRVLNPDPIFAAPAQFVSPNGTAGVGVFRGEDFFLWAGRRGLHLLWHVKQPFSTSKVGWKLSGATAFSEDGGLTWTPASTEAYDGTPTWRNGGSLALVSRQRPQLLFDDPADSFRPTLLFNGVQECSSAVCFNGAYDYSWTLAMPFAGNIGESQRAARDSEGAKR